MERAIAEMEKIKRAEEIYSRRKNLDEKEKKDSPKSFYKVLFEILFLIDVIILILAIQNQKYIFTDEFIKNVNSYNVNIKSKLEKLFISPNVETEKSVKKEENIVSENTSVSGESNNVTSPQYSFTMPVEGTITSKFGERNSTNSKVTKYHTGIDIAVVKGTPIKSAISGKVTQVSEEGDYGNHLRIVNNNIEILYAHCSKINVKQGQEVKQGEIVALSGSTGNSTGPHLHFEIKIDGKLVDPENVIK